MPEATAKPRLPPRWFIRLAWFVHRNLYRLTRGPLDRSVMVGYFEEGPNRVTMAMNGWGEGEPAWWLNLQTHPDATVDLRDGPREVTGRAAEGDERERLWARWQGIDDNLDAYAARRSTETAVVILEPS